MNYYSGEINVKYLVRDSKKEKNHLESAWPIFFSQLNAPSPPLKKSTNINQTEQIKDLVFIEPCKESSE